MDVEIIKGLAENKYPYCN